MYFVIYERQNIDGTWSNNVFTYPTYNQAMHQFHATMSTYGYGQSDTYNYVACFVQNDSGAIVKSEVDDRRNEVIPEEVTEPTEE